MAFLAAPELEIPDAENGLTLIPKRVKGDSSPSSVEKPTSAKNKKNPGNEKAGKRSKEGSKVKKEKSEVESEKSASADWADDDNDEDKEGGDEGSEEVKGAGARVEKEEQEMEGGEDDEEFDKLCSISGKGLCFFLFYFYHIGLCLFLDATTLLYKKSCPSVRRSVRLSGVIFERRKSLFLRLERL